MAPHVLAAETARADDFAAIQFNFVRLWGTMQDSDPTALQNGNRRDRTIQLTTMRRNSRRPHQKETGRRHRAEATTTAAPRPLHYNGAQRRASTTARNGARASHRPWARGALRPALRSGRDAALMISGLHIILQGVHTADYNAIPLHCFT